VLVVEDDPHDREVLVRVLANAGYAVTAVAAAAEARRAWLRKAFDAVALSATLPDSGELRSLLEAIRSEKSSTRVPVIAMAVVADVNAAAGFAVTDVLAKPIDARALLAALEHGGAPPARGTHVLVIDDDAGSLRLMEATLGNLGYKA